jgi:hypothetical protein
VTKAEFISTYVERVKALGFDVKATRAGCIYGQNPEFGHYYERLRLFAAPCDCGCAEGWGMVEVVG